jgi:hypothetical protein
MQKLRDTIAEYGHWDGLLIYVERIEAAQLADFSLALENAKALLESVGKEICSKRNVTLKAAPTINDILKSSFTCLGYANSDLVNQVSRALASIGQEIGNLRNEISPTSHGRSLEELRERNSKVDLLSRDFLIDSTLIVAVFLIRAFELKKSVPILEMLEADAVPHVQYDDAQDFNESWDDTYGEFAMGSYSYPASEILYQVDSMAYQSEYTTFKAEAVQEENA